MSAIATIRRYTTATGETARFTTMWLSPSAAVITIRGELDAANADEFAAYIGEHTARTNRLVLDLSKVCFFGTAALSALQSFGDACTAAGDTWTVVPGRAVNRLADICNADLPRHPTVAAALAAAHRG